MTGERKQFVKTQLTKASWRSINFGLGWAEVGFLRPLCSLLCPSVLSHSTNQKKPFVRGPRKITQFFPTSKSSSDPPILDVSDLTNFFENFDLKLSRSTRNSKIVGFKLTQTQTFTSSYMRIGFVLRLAHAPYNYSYAMICQNIYFLCIVYQLLEIHSYA